MEEILKQISMDLQNLAMPRTYDWLILLVSLTSIILSFIIFKRQTKISNKQTEIMKEQNRIALFEKRYEAYVELAKMAAAFEFYNEDTPCVIYLKQVLMTYRVDIRSIDFKKINFEQIEEMVNLCKDCYVKSIPVIMSSVYLFEININTDAVFLDINDFAHTCVERILYTAKSQKSYSELKMADIYENYNLEKLSNIFSTRKILYVVLNKVLEQMKSQLKLSKEVSPCPTPKPTTKTQ